MFELEGDGAAVPSNASAPEDPLGKTLSELRRRLIEHRENAGKVDPGDETAVDDADARFKDAFAELRRRVRTHRLQRVDEHSDRSVPTGKLLDDAEDAPRARIVLRRADGSLIKKPEELRPTPTAALNAPHREGEERSDAVSPETSNRPRKRDEPSDAAVLSGETREADAQHPLPSDDGVSAAPLLKPVPSPTQTQAVPRAAASMAPGSAVALDLSHLAGCTLTGSVQWWAPNLPSWLKLDADEGIAHGRVPSDHAPDLIAVSVVCANDLGATATLCVTVRIEA